MSPEAFKCGDVVRWRSYEEGVEFHYGLVIKSEDLTEIGYLDFPYSTYSELEKMDYSHVSLRKVTLFSFHEQKVVIFNQTQQDLPTFPELWRSFDLDEKN